MRHNVIVHCSFADSPPIRFDPARLTAAAALALLLVAPRAAAQQPTVENSRLYMKVCMTVSVRTLLQQWASLYPWARPSASERLLLDAIPITSHNATSRH
jgi:hypothetical protein